MFRILNYYGRFQQARGQWGGLPSWGRGVLFVAALPGLILALLSVAAFAISVGVFLLLVVPVYRLLGLFQGSGRPAPRTTVERIMDEMPGMDVPPAASPSPGRRHIEVTIIE